MQDDSLRFESIAWVERCGGGAALLQVVPLEHRGLLVFDWLQEIGLADKSGMLAERPVFMVANDVM